METEREKVKPDQRVDYESSEDLLRKAMELKSRIISTDGTYQDRLKGLHEVMKEYDKKSIEMEKNPVMRFLMKLGAEFGISIRPPGYYIKRGREEVQRGIAQYDKLLRKIEYDRDSLEEERENLAEARNKELTIRKMLKQGKKKVKSEIAELNEQYRAGEEDGPNCRDIRMKNNLQREYDKKYRECELATQGYHLKIEKLKEAISDMDAKIELVDLLQFRLKEANLTSIPKINTMGYIGKIGEIETKAEQALRTLEKTVETYNDLSEETNTSLVALIPPKASKKRDTSYRRRQRENEARILRKEVKQRTDARSIEIDELEAKVREDPLY